MISFPRRGTSRGGAHVVALYAENYYMHTGCVPSNIVNASRRCIPGAAFRCHLLSNACFGWFSCSSCNVFTLPHRLGAACRDSRHPAQAFRIRRPSERGVVLEVGGVSPTGKSLICVCEWVRAAMCFQSLGRAVPTFPTAAVAALLCLFSRAV